MKIKGYGLVIGWIVGMILQIPILFMMGNLNSVWWTVQLSGLGIATIISVLLDKSLKKKIKSKLSQLTEKTQPLEKTKSKDGDRLTEWEKDFVWKSLKKTGKIVCINCEGAHMYEGPSGGMSVNIRCPKCGQGINFMTLHDKDRSALDWCDNIGINTAWIHKNYDKVIPEAEKKVETKSNTASIKFNWISNLNWKSILEFPEKIWKSFIEWLNN